MVKLNGRKAWRICVSAAVLALLLPLSLWAAGLSLDQAIAKVKRDTGGKVLTASTVRRGNQEVHRVKVLMPQGRVRIIEVKGMKRGS